MGASCAMTVRVSNVTCDRCICLHLSSIARELKISGKRKRLPEQEKIGKTRSYCSVQVEDRQEYLSTETASVAPKESVGKRDLVSNILLLLSFGKLMRLVQLILVGGNQRRL